ncbi:hypothetical protein K438DRAFT_1770609 [Mycena galopus ATCC 62051]|nr:hypothetical protein K438DRAFT_1770609 [Mycena galopus ATCC 62051]
MRLLAAKIAAVATITPSSVATGIKIDWKEWFQKQIAQMSDYAADQARKHELTVELKHKIVIEDLGVAFKSSCRAMAEAWPQGEQLVFLANKANDTTIWLSDASSAAVWATEDVVHGELSR